MKEFWTAFLVSFLFIYLVGFYSWLIGYWASRGWHTAKAKTPTELNLNIKGSKNE